MIKNDYHLFIFSNYIMSENTLSHTLDKVRYFRNLLVSEDKCIRILIGTDRLFAALDMALKDMKDVKCNKLLIMYDGKTQIKPDGILKEDFIQVFIKPAYDDTVVSMMETYSDWEVVSFKKDPTLE